MHKHLKLMLGFSWIVSLTKPPYLAVSAFLPLSFSLAELMLDLWNVFLCAPNLYECNCGLKVASQKQFYRHNTTFSFGLFSLFLIADNKCPPGGNVIYAFDFISPYRLELNPWNLHFHFLFFLLGPVWQCLTSRSVSDFLYFQFLNWCQTEKMCCENLPAVFPETKHQ